MDAMPSFSPILLEEAVLSVIVAVVLILYAAMSIIYSYHWRRFGIPTAFFYRMTRLYFLGSGGLAIIALVLYVSVIGMT
jgi:hypothetical protein